MINALTMEANTFVSDKLLKKELSGYFSQVDMEKLIESLIPDGVALQKIGLAGQRDLKYANISDYEIYVEGVWKNIILMINNFENNKDPFFISEYNFDIVENTKIVKGKIILTRYNFSDIIK